MKTATQQLNECMAEYYAAEKKALEDVLNVLHTKLFELHGASSHTLDDDELLDFEGHVKDYGAQMHEVIVNVTENNIIVQLLVDGELLNWGDASIWAISGDERAVFWLNIARLIVNKLC